MSSKKRRKTVRLEDDEIAVVGSKDKWEHLVMVYNRLAEDAPEDEKPYWYDAAAWITEYLTEEEYIPNVGYYEGE